MKFPPTNLCYLFPQLGDSNRLICMLAEVRSEMIVHKRVKDHLFFCNKDGLNGVAADRLTN